LWALCYLGDTERVFFDATADSFSRDDLKANVTARTFVHLSSRGAGNLTPADLHPIAALRLASSVDVQFERLCRQRPLDRSDRKKPELLASASHKKSLATLSHLGSLGGAPWRRQARQTSLCETAFKD
jgi:hypothetical protein